jgi:hypothetical protein
MSFIFDGPNLLITLPPGTAGVGQIDAQDVYSAWKAWVLVGDNAKYPPAFRTIGGDPLSSIINAGAYYFLRNDFGWRMKPAEEDVNYYLTGNLAAQDTFQSILIPTEGDFTVAIFGLQPVTQGVTPAMAQQLEYGSFQGGIWIDQINGQSGTDGTKGNAQFPVNNIPDAITIQQIRGLPKTVYVRGNLVLGTGDNIEGFKLVGENATRTLITVNAESDTLGCEIIEAHVTGNLDGGTILRNCVISNLNYINGFVYNCMLNPGTISLGGTETAHFLNCYSGVPGSNTPTIDMNGTGTEDTPLAMRNYNGGIRLVHKTGTAPVSIDLGAGQVILDIDRETPANSTVLGGNIVVRGDGGVYDAHRNHLGSGTYGGVTLYNGVTGADHIHDMWQDMGLDPENPTSYTDDGTTTTKVSGGVTLEITDNSVTRQ